MNKLILISALIAVTTASAFAQVGLTSVYNFNTERVQSGVSVGSLRALPRLGEASPTLSVVGLFDSNAYDGVYRSGTLRGFSNFYVGPALNLPLYVDNRFTLNATATYTFNMRRFERLDRTRDNGFGLGVTVGYRF